GRPLPAPAALAALARAGGGGYPVGPRATLCRQRGSLCVQAPKRTVRTWARSTCAAQLRLERLFQTLCREDPIRVAVELLHARTLQALQYPLWQLTKFQRQLALQHLGATFDSALDSALDSAFDPTLDSALGATLGHVVVQRADYFLCHIRCLSSDCDTKCVDLLWPCRRPQVLHQRSGCLPPLRRHPTTGYAKNASARQRAAGGRPLPAPAALAALAPAGGGGYPVGPT